MAICLFPTSADATLFIFSLRKIVDEDRIDASAGLVLSLELFQMHKLNGTLYAELHRVPPGIAKHSTAIMEIVNGEVVSCSVLDKKGQRKTMMKESLIQLNEEKGPFEWTFQQAKPTKPISPLSARSTHSPSQQSDTQLPPTVPLHQSGPSLARAVNHAIPIPIAPMDWQKLSHWSDQQRQSLLSVCHLIDGQRTIQDMKVALETSYPPAFVDEAVEVLLALHVIVLNE